MKNVVEALVLREYERLLPTVSGACGCVMCREDVMVYALNRLQPHYVATPAGEVISGVEMEKVQGQADIAVALMDAFRVVGSAPRHGRRATKAR
ncbi:MAG: late competence development ComFB family protein [Gemmatimonadales bacterium]|jgi:competence protein ComFB